MSKRGRNGHGRSKTTIQSHKLLNGKSFAVQIVSPYTTYKIPETFFEERVIVNVDEYGKVNQVPRNG